MAKLHPILQDAAQGTLPAWTEASKSRRAHMRRVATLIEQWARELGKSSSSRQRWIAAALLHDALKDETPAKLRRMLSGKLRLLPDGILHGPAAAAKLRKAGVEDENLLMAIRFHTLGHPEFTRIGKMLYAADFLEPGRRVRKRWREGLRARMPEDVDGVVHEIVGARIQHLLKKGRPVRPETVALWNLNAEGEAWVRASVV